MSCYYARDAAFGQPNGIRKWPFSISTCKALQALLHVASRSAGVLLAFLVGEVPDPAINRESCGRGKWSATPCLRFRKALDNLPNPLHFVNHVAVRGMEAKLMLYVADVDHVALLMLPGPELVSTIHDSRVDGWAADRDSLAYSHVPSILALAALRP